MAERLAVAQEAAGSIPVDQPMPYGVTVAQLPLEQFVGVQIPIGQPVPIVQRPRTPAPQAGNPDSNSGGDANAGVAQPVERVLGKDEAIGSIPITSSIRGVAQLR